MSTTVSENASGQLNSTDLHVEYETSKSAGASPRWLNHRIAAATEQLLGSIQGGQIQFNNGWESKTFGSFSTDALRADLTVNDPRFYRSLLSEGSIGFAESYMARFWSTDDLTALLRVLCRNMHRMNSIDKGVSKLASSLARMTHRLARNTIAGSRRNIAAHYDLSNEFFELFLDQSMMYSSAYYRDESMSLEQASEAKLEQLCRKLDLQANDHVLEIGTGWGGFVLHAAQEFGSRITTTTISENQYLTAKRRIHDAKIADRVTLLQQDYRELTGQFDKLISIEMVEAVGEQFLNDYFRKCGELLQPGGRFVLQGIVMPERRYESYRKSVDFIQKYIFPGGFLPSVAGMLTSVGQTSDLTLDSVEDLSAHYARTLAEWRSRFMNRLDEVRALGFDERFIRMWEYYLCYCEAAFAEQAVKVVQIVWDKPAR